MSNPEIPVPEAAVIRVLDMRVSTKSLAFAFQMGKITDEQGQPVEVPESDQPPTDAMVMLEVHHVGGADAWDQPVKSQFVLDPVDAQALILQLVLSLRTVQQLDAGRN